MTSRTRTVAGAVAATLAVGALSAFAASPASAAVGLLSRGAAVTASSTEGGFVAANAVDGDHGTRWGSSFSDTQWLRLDLGKSSRLDHLELDWEAAYGRDFTVSASDDGTTWTRVGASTGGTGGDQTVALTGQGRYLRIDFTQRATGYGYSLWEVEVFGEAGGSTPTPTPAATPTQPPTSPGTCGTTNLAAGGSAAATSTQGDLTAAKAIDGNTGTRWGSAERDGESITVDLGAVRTLCGVRLLWEAAYGKAYRIDVSTDGSTWKTAASVTAGDGGTDDVAISADARYVRMSGVTRGTGYGYSLWEFQVFGSGGTTTPPTTPPVQGGGSLGPNVKVYDDATPDATIQADLDAAFTVEEANQFGDQRYQFLFKPGSYDVNANVGFYTSVSGAGRNPQDVTLNGGVWADAGWFNGNATQNFWRSVENLAINPVGGEARWAVSQAAPMRRVQVNGNLNLAPSTYGWASGGFIADTRVTGKVGSYSQQQWLSRDSQFGSWDGSVWNMAFSGVQGSPAPHFPNPSHTVEDTTPVSSEKPYLYWDTAASDWAVFSPSVRRDARGVSWANGSTPGTSIPLSKFYVAKPGDSAATINAALAQGLNLLLTPGVFHVDDTIRVNRADTVVLGLGYATIVNDGGVAAMRVADVNGVSISGILFDAGTTQAPVLLEIGPSGASADHTADPITVHDVFLRVGGAVAGKVTDAMVVNSDDTIVDHIWSWRADHGAGVGWNVNTSRHGLVVNGDDVTALGLFVEHFQQYNVLWNGDRGRTFFYQSELAYDPPNQAAWMNGSRLGWAGYKVADAVTTHSGTAMGVYSYNNADPSIVTQSGFEVPDKPGVHLRNVLTVSLGGNGIIRHVVNDTGGEASGTNTIPSYLASYN